MELAASSLMFLPPAGYSTDALTETSALYGSDPGAGRPGDWFGSAHVPALSTTASTRKGLGLAGRTGRVKVEGEIEPSRQNPPELSTITPLASVASGASLIVAYRGQVTVLPCCRVEGLQLRHSSLTVA